MQEDRLELPAYLITFTTYGTWLPGDRRGSVDRRHDRPGWPHAAGNREVEQRNSERLKYAPFHIGQRERTSISEAIAEVCRVRHWQLCALNLRTCHLHVVVLGQASGDRMMNDFKAYATRRLVVSGLARPGQKLWTRGGSVRLIRTAGSLERACAYARDHQGARLPGNIELAGAAQGTTSAPC